MILNVTTVLMSAIPIRTFDRISVCDTESGRPTEMTLL
jgi:hypothetical protein